MASAEQGPSASPHGSVSRRIFIVQSLIVLGTFITLCVRAQDPPLSQTALSRLATVASLTEDGTWYIDRPPGDPANRFEVFTIDKVQVNGRLISSKPPLLPWIMTLEYRLLRAATGWSLDNSADTKRVLFAFTLTFCVLPWTLALIAGSALLNRWIPHDSGRVMGLIALAVGTQAFGFASVFNNHVPAAAALVICGWLISRLVDRETRSIPVALLAGFAGGLVATFDVPNTVYVCGLFALPLLRFRNGNWVAVGVGAAVPVLVQSWLLLQSTGSPLPVQVRPDTYLYESAYWRNPLGVDALSEPKGRYAFNMTIGNRGIFVLYPILLAGLAGPVVALAHRTDLRRALLGACLCVAVVFGYYIAGTSNYGGEVYGMRWLIPSMPVLLFMAIPVLRRANQPVIAAVLALALAVSVYSAWQAGTTPWASSQEWPRRVFGF